MMNKINEQVKTFTLDCALKIIIYLIKSIISSINFNVKSYPSFYFANLKVSWNSWIKTNIL